MNLISTRIHGMMDYGTVAAMLAVPRALQWKKPLPQLFAAGAVVTFIYSALTHYELGVIKVLPLKGHLGMDILNGASYCAAPLLVKTDQPKLLIGFGLYEIMAAIMTEKEIPITVILKERLKNTQPEMIAERL